MFLSSESKYKDISIEYYIALNIALRVNTLMKKRLLDYYKGDLEYLFHKAGFKEIRSLFSREATAKKFYDIRENSLRRSERELKEVKSRGITLLPIYSDNYPYMLKKIADPPILLYCRGSLIGESHLSYIAIVGRRKASDIGIANAYRVAKGIAGLGIVVVSGLAIGVDAASHMGAISGGGKTIAVLACGLDIVYPKVNSELFSHVIDNGCILSEFSLGTAPVAYHFPIRNRIIAGLSIAVVVVEAGEKSGSLYTTMHALEWGRDVYAFPGPAGSPYYSGSHSLIKQGAKLIENADDLVEDLKLVLDFSDAKSFDRGDQSKNKVLSDLYNERDVLSKERVKRKSIRDDKKVKGNVEEKEEKKGERSLVESKVIEEKKSPIDEGIGGKKVSIDVEEMGFDEDTKLIYRCLDYKNKKGFDDIVEETGISVSKVISILNLLYIRNLCSKEDEFYYK